MFSFDKIPKSGQFQFMYQYLDSQLGLHQPFPAGR